MHTVSREKQCLQMFPYGHKSDIVSPLGSNNIVNTNGKLKSHKL